MSEFKSPEPGHYHHPQHTEDEKTESNHSKGETTSDNKTERKTGIKERVMIVSK